MEVKRLLAAARTDFFRSDTDPSAGSLITINPDSMGTFELGPMGASSNFDPNDPLYQLAVALGHTGVFALTKPSTYVYWYGASAVGAVGAVGIAAVAELPTVAVVVGEGSPFHVAFGTGGAWLHATGEFFNMTITSASAAAFVRGYQYFQFNVPVINPQAVMGTAGEAASSCVTGACYAILQGWIK